MLPTLPTELLSQIIDHATPDATPSTLQARYDLLLAVSAVHSTFLGIARECLFTHVRLRHNKAIGSFCDAMRNDQTGVGQKVVQLWLGDVDSQRVGGDRDALGDMSGLLDALEGCPNVEEVSIADLEVTVEDLAVFPGKLLGSPSLSRLGRDQAD